MRKDIKYRKEATIALFVLTGALVVTIGVSIFNSNKEKENFTTAVYNSKEYSCFDECADKIITLKNNNGETTKMSLFSAVQLLQEQLEVVNLLPDDIELSEELVKDNKTVIKYEVVYGDTLSEIAEKYEVSVNYLKEENNLTSDTIHPGQIIKITKYEYKLEDYDTAETMLELYEDFNSLTYEQKIELLNKIQGSRKESEEWIAANGSKIAEYLCLIAIKSKVADAYEMDENKINNITINDYYEASDLFGTDVEVEHYSVDKKGHSKSVNVFLTGELSLLQNRLYQIQTAKTQGEELSYEYLEETIELASSIISKDVKTKNRLLGDKIKLVKVNM